jgi:uncharacterized membrane protein SpoIIM required for sporulation
MSLRNASQPSQAAFEHRYAADWQRFERWLATQSLGRRARTELQRRRKEAAASDPAGGEIVDDVLADEQVPRQYRLLCAQLALARDRRYSPALVARLHRLVLGGHHALYAVSGERLQVMAFLRGGFPRLVRAEWRVVGLASLLFFAPLLGLLAALQWFPDLATTIVAPMRLAEIQRMYDPANELLGQRAAEGHVEMFGFYIWNNVRIGFQTFAGGVLFGLGSVFFLVFNGVFLGTVLGHLTQVGLGPQIWSFVAGHSALELVAIAISGGAGLKLGAALLAPGRRSRRAALVANGRIALQLAGGAALMFLAAAVVEAFWSPLVWPDPRPKYVVGIIAWVLLLAYFARAGHRDAA